MGRFSAFSLAWHALSHHRNWTRYWQNSPLAKKYDVLIIGAGGHGLATAHYLAKNHGITKHKLLGCILQTDFANRCGKGMGKFGRCAQNIHGAGKAMGVQPPILPKGNTINGDGRINDHPADFAWWFRAAGMKVKDPRVGKHGLRPTRGIS